jgi:ABC-type phosphate/phosphonate transport system substrate-binding protein
VHAFSGRLRVLATPTYRAPGCGPGRYSSILVVRASDVRVQDLGDLRGRVCALNDRASHSGMNALRRMLAGIAPTPRFFSSVRVTGSHAASIEHVKSGAADVCAVDAVTHALLTLHRPDSTAGTRVLAMTGSAPALPYVTRADAPTALVAILREALTEAARDPDPELVRARAALLLDDVTPSDESLYDEIRTIEQEAIAAGYAELE